MAELLIRIKESARGNMNKDKWDRTRPHVGDIIDIRDDGFNWGKSVITAVHSKLIKVPGLTRKELRHYLASEAEVDFIDEDGYTHTKTKHYRKYKLDPENLSEKDIADLGSSEIAKETRQQLLENKIADKAEVSGLGN